MRGTGLVPWHIRYSRRLKARLRCSFRGGIGVVTSCWFKTSINCVILQRSAHCQPDDRCKRRCLCPRSRSLSACTTCRLYLLMITLICGIRFRTSMRHEAATDAMRCCADDPSARLSHRARRSARSQPLCPLARARCAALQQRPQWRRTPRESAVRCRS